MEILKKTITYPKGYKGGALHTGIKKSAKDISLLASDRKAVWAGCFTTNIVKAAPVLWDMKILEQGGEVSGVVINSGNANACTGEQGKADCENMALCFAQELNCAKEEVLVCSTGVIGVNLDMAIVLKGIKAVAEEMDYSHEKGLMAAEGIMTTDTFAKYAGGETIISGKEVKVGGMSKGSGMIHPNMATTLCILTTDANISAQLLQKALKEVTEDTFNMISVDGDTSTNDSIIVLANGMAENSFIDEENQDYILFKELLFGVVKKLAVDIAKDGEGATKLLEVTVQGAKTKKDARLIARSVTASSLFKAALFGEDANWGRVLCAMGYSGGQFNPEAVDIIFKSCTDGVMDSIKLMDKGNPIKFDEEHGAKILKEDTVYIDIILSEGEESATAWGCDLTYDYVKINGDYRS